MQTKTSTPHSNTQMAERLIDVLSDTYMLTIKTHGYHWNVTGPLFPQLHLLFEGQYNDLFAAADALAERVRALDFPAPGSTVAFKENTVIQEATGQPMTAVAMVKDLLKSHEAMRERVEEARASASAVQDSATEDLLIGRLSAHDKIIWMLRSQVVG